MAQAQRFGMLDAQTLFGDHAVAGCPDQGHEVECHARLGAAARRRVGPNPQLEAFIPGIAGLVAVTDHDHRSSLPALTLGSLLGVERWAGTCLTKRPIS